VIHPAEVAQEIKKFSFFSSFPTDAILTIATMATVEVFPDGAILLEQGKTNDSLMFLRSGRVRILVDGEKVMDFDTAGEVFGEISLINRRPTTATVQAMGEVNIFKVSESHLNTLPTKERDNFQRLLYRVYATVLADRLVKTSEKAKRFEITNRELEAAQLSLRKMNEDLETELVRRSQETVQKIHDLTETHLLPVLKTLQGWSQATEIQLSADEYHEVGRRISEVIDFFKPMMELSQRGKGMEIRRVLLCDTNKKQQTLARLALSGTGVELGLASTVEEIELRLSEKSYNLVLCESEMRDGVEKVIQKAPDTPIAIIVGIDMSTYLETIRVFPKQSYFVSRDMNNRLFTLRNISTTVSKIINKDFYGMEKYLSWGTKIVKFPFGDSSKRASLIEDMKTYFRTFGIRPGVLDRVHAATEELLMNAVYDAPVDVRGQHLYNHKSRQERVVLRPEHEATFGYGTDGVLLGVSVMDPFGALSKEIIMAYLDSCYSGRAGELNKNKGGAGRGLHMIIESSDLTIFNITRHKRTEVIVLFNLDRTAEEAVRPSFHLFIN
jgi:CRP-like cAMP-binding protein/CheY-like chemotaxis protein